MRFSTLIALILPLSAALAAPSLVRRNENFQNLQLGISQANQALRLIRDFASSNPSPKMLSDSQEALESLSTSIAVKVNIIEEILRNEQAPPVANIQEVSNRLDTAMSITNRLDGEIGFVPTEEMKRNFIEARNGVTLAVKSFIGVLTETMA